jgi:MT-A70 protein
MLPQALEVMAAQEFTYKTCAVWAKDRISTGYRFRNKQRFCWSGRGGRIPAPAPGRQWPSLIEASVREHSRKPDAIYKLIEAYFSNLPKIELFARHARSGWDRWGGWRSDSPPKGGDTSRWCRFAPCSDDTAAGRQLAPRVNQRTDSTLTPSKGRRGQRFPFVT